MSILRTVCGATALLLLVSCSQTVSGTGHTGFPTDVKSVGALLQGNRSVRTARIELTEASGATTVHSTGSEKLTDTKVDAMDMSETVNGTAIRFIIIGATVYAKLPASTPITHDKPWVELTAATTDPTLQQLYAQFQSSRTAGVAFTSDVFDAAARNLELVGTGQLDGVLVAHYTLDLDVQALPSSFPQAAQLKQTGLKQVPLQVWVDAQGHTRKFSESLTVAGQHVTVEYGLSAIDQPVHIVAPPPGQVEQR